MSEVAPSRARSRVSLQRRQEIDERLATCSAEAYETYCRVRTNVYALVGEGSYALACAEAEEALGLVELIHAAPDAVARLEFLPRLIEIERRAAQGFALKRRPRRDRAALKAFRACPRCSCCDHADPEDVTPPG